MNYSVTKTRDAVLEGASSNCFDDVCRAWFERRVDLATNLREERPDRDPAIEDRRGGFLAHASPVGGYSRQRARSDGDDTLRQFQRHPVDPERL